MIIILPKTKIKYLKFVYLGAPCEVHTRNGIVYKCVCARADPKFNTLCLDDVNTGIGNITHAFMRTSDIEYMQLKIDS